MAQRLVPSLPLPMPASSLDDLQRYATATGGTCSNSCTRLLSALLPVHTIGCMTRIPCPPWGGMRHPSTTAGATAERQRSQHGGSSWRASRRDCLGGLRCACSGAGPGGLSLCVAAGPFTTSEDLGYAPLAELLGSCAAAPPDALLLVGPFVDVEHPLVASGALDVTFEDLFHSQARAGLPAHLSIAWCCLHSPCPDHPGVSELLLEPEDPTRASHLPTGCLDEVLHCSAVA